MMTIQRVPLAILIFSTAFILASCERSTEPLAQVTNAGAVVVYANYSDESYLPEYFKTFTETTGIRVIVRNTEEHVDEVIAHRGSPPADVLLTPDVSGIWRAADEGALRPLALGPVREKLPAWSRDPEGYWVGISVRTAVIAYSAQAVDFVPPAGYGELAEPRFRERLCLASSSSAVNRTVIAMLIDELGVRPAEIVVRGWMANLALPVFDAENDLLRAIESGQCQIGLVSSDQLLMLAGNANASVREAAVARQFANIEGVGIARHASNPEAALALTEWMLSDAAQSRHWQESFSYSVTDTNRLRDIDNRNVATVGWRDEEVAKLAERAGYR